MTSSHAFRRFAFTYGTAFAVLYVIALKLDLALFTVYPAQSVVLLGSHLSRDVVDPTMSFLAPTMHWYGWTASAALGALVFGLLGALLPERWAERMWSGWLWVTPLAAMSACVYLTMPWFRLNIATALREVPAWPVLVNLRADPFERAPSDSGMYIRWYADNICLFVPVQQKLQQFLVALPEYPFQQGSSLNAANINYNSLQALQTMKRLKQLETLRPPGN